MSGRPAHRPNATVTAKLRGDIHERHFPSTHRKAARTNDEAGVFLYAPAIRQSADATHGALGAAATSFRHVLRESAKLDGKLQLHRELLFLIREQVARINGCLFCMDIGRWAAIEESMNAAKFDALGHYATSALFTDAERAVLDYVTELTKSKKVSRDSFAGLSSHYSEREICEIVWLVASEHLYNITNIGLNIHSDMLCDLASKTADLRTMQS
jgi:alkylhydroperoxidase family enzyme